MVGLRKVVMEPPLYTSLWPLFLPLGVIGCTLLATGIAYSIYAKTLSPIDAAAYIVLGAFSLVLLILGASGFRVKRRMAKFRKLLSQLVIDAGDGCGRIVAPSDASIEAGHLIVSNIGGFRRRFEQGGSSGEELCVSSLLEEPYTVAMKERGVSGYDYYIDAPALRIKWRGVTGYLIVLGAHRVAPARSEVEISAAGDRVVYRPRRAGDAIVFDVEYEKKASMWAGVDVVVKTPKPWFSAERICRIVDGGKYTCKWMPLELREPVILAHLDAGEMSRVRIGELPLSRKHVSAQAILGSKLLRVIYILKLHAAGRAGLILEVDRLMKLSEQDSGKQQ